MTCCWCVQELQQIQEAYQTTHGRALLDDVIADTSGDFKDLLKQLLRCERPQGEIVDRKLAEQDAKRLYKVHVPTTSAALTYRPSTAVSVSALSDRRFCTFYNER